MQEDNKMTQENNEKEQQKMTITTTGETLPPGRELDAKVAEALGGVVHWADELTGSTEYAPLVEDEGSWYMGKATTTICPHYSTSIGDAWPLVEKYKFILIPPNEMLGKWQACVTIGLSPHLRYLAYGDTAPHAICLAYLALKENEGKE